MAEDIRQMAIEPGSARLIKEEKQGSPLKRLKSGEISMLFTLVIVAVAALTIYYVLFPMYTNLAVLEKENEALRIEESNMRTQIDLATGFQEMYDEARADYVKYIAMFYGPMEPELIDDRITNMMISHEMTPTSLSMTNLTVEGVPPYMVEELRTNPVPAPPNEGGEGPVADTSGTAGTADESNSAPQEFNDYAFVYTVSVSANGKRDNLYTFLAQVYPMTAMEVVNFTFSDTDEKGSLVVGTINMTLKLYVFAPGVPANQQTGTG
jgi:hypothetical protein